MKKGYVTYISNDRDYKGVLLLHYNLYKLGSVYSLICLVTENVSNKVLGILSNNHIDVKKIDTRHILDFSSQTFSNILRNLNYFGKLYVFNLGDYETIIYLDTDLLILKNIDHLFELPNQPSVYMAEDVLINCGTIKTINNNFNSGVIVIHYNSNIYGQIRSILLAKNQEFDGLFRLKTDQCILNEIYRKDKNIFGTLDIAYNCPSMLATKIESPTIIHFIRSPKPWNILDMDIISNLYSNPYMYFKQWIEMYHEMVQKKLQTISVETLPIDKIVPSTFNYELGRVQHIE